MTHEQYIARLRIWIEDWLNSLSPRQRQCAVRYFIDGMESGDIASDLGIGTRAVSVSLRKAKAKADARRSTLPVK